MLKIKSSGTVREITQVQYAKTDGQSLSVRAITYIMNGSRIVWQAIRSCFGNGYWINDKPWLGDEAWKNN